MIRSEECGKTFNSLSSWRRHQLRHHTRSDEVYACPKCDKSWTNKITLQHHLRTVHKPESVCTLCGKSTKNMRIHMATTHSEKRAFQCLDCQKAFKLRGHLKRHCRTSGHQYVKDANASKEEEVEKCEGAE